MKNDQYFQKAEYYENNALWQKKSAEVLVRMANNDLSNFKFDKIIDIGCGTGFVLDAILKHNSIRGKKITLFDKSHDMINGAYKKFQKYNNVKYLNGDFEHYTINEQYSVLFSNMALHWCKNFRETLEKACNISGTVFISILLDSSMKEVNHLYQAQNIKNNIIPLQNLRETIAIVRAMGVEYSHSVQTITEKNTLLEFYQNCKSNGTINLTKNQNVQQSANIIKNNPQILNINYDILYLKIWQ